MQTRLRAMLTASGFVLPALVLLAVFVLAPVGYMAWASLRRGAEGFVGLENYRHLWLDPLLRRSLTNTAVFTLLVVPLQTVLALALAVWVHGQGLARRGLRLAVFLPATVSLAVLSVVWKLLYEPVAPTGTGLFNGLLTAVGLPAQPFLASPGQALPSIAAMSIWQGVGLQMLVLLAGLQHIPEQLYEAAKLDGAGRWGRFRAVTLPGLAPTLVFVVTVTTMLALRLFVQPYVMTRGGPGDATRSVVQYVYEAAFRELDFALACAAGTLFFVIVLGLTVVLRLVLRWVEART